MVAIAVSVCTGASGVASAQSADLEVTNYAQVTPILAGRSDAYSSFVKNLGPDTAQQVVLTNVLPVGAIPGGYTVCIEVGGDVGFACTDHFNAPPVNGAYAVAVGDLVKDQEAVVYVYVTTVANSGPLTDTATATSATPDPVPGNNTASATINFVLGADVELTMTAVQQRHSEVVVSLGVTNNGPGVAGFVTASLGSSGGSISSVTASAGVTCVSNGTGATCRPGDMAVGSQFNVTINMKLGSGTLSLFALADSATPDTDFSNNTASASFTNNGATTTTFKEDYDANNLSYVPCANEYVSITGRIHNTETVTLTPGGSSGHIDFHSNATEMTAIGLTSGARYTATGSTTSSQHFTALPTSFTFVQHSNLIGQGNVPNLSVDEVFHLTIDANGRVTSAKDTQRITCK